MHINYRAKLLDRGPDIRYGLTIPLILFKSEVTNPATLKGSGCVHKYKLQRPGSPR